MIIVVREGIVAQDSQNSKPAFAADGGVLFYGDPHGKWQPLIDAVARKNPESVIILGDLAEPKRDPHSVQTAREALNTLLDAGIDVRLISGNHDTDTAAAHDLVFEEFGAHLIGGQVVELGRQKVKVAALGGVFRGRIWYPRDLDDGGKTATFHSASELWAATPKTARLRGGIPLKQRSSIFPEAVEQLRLQTADVLVCHEAPSSHDCGFPVIDQLATNLGANLIVHGHHHQAYAARLKNGIRVRGLGMAEAWELLEGEIWGRIHAVLSAIAPQKTPMKAATYENIRHRKAHVQRPERPTPHAKSTDDCRAAVHERVASSR